MSDYLFDKRGEPDPEVERLEGLLGSLGYRGAPPRLPARRPRRSFFVVAAGLSAIAVALLAVVIARPWPWRSHRAGEQAPRASWAATVRDGTATIDGQPMTGATELPVGVWLESQSGRVRLAVADLGFVELAPGTRTRIVATGAARHELQLAHGTLAAVIDAPPRHFVVSTPRARVTDLGCAFELTVDEAGRGRLVVTGGRVAVSDGGGREVVVDAGARVELTERGPGVPFALDPAQPAAPSQQPAQPRSPSPAQPQSPSPAQLQSPSRAQLQVSRPAQPQSPQPAESDTPKPPRRTTRATTAPAGARKPGPANVPATSPARTSPARKPDPAAPVEHDPLKALEHSVE